MSENWLWMRAVDLGRGIEAGEIDALALTQTYLAAAEAHELSARIYARVSVDRALASARAASDRARHGRRLGLLDGVPVSWKDLFDTAGIGTEAGTALLEGRVPETDATVVTRAEEAGLVCLGKTHMSELAFSGLGYNPVTGTPPTVNDRDAAPGGSSSGAAASVAFGLAAAGIGSDTAGSVRVPAAWNDLVGLKTTFGLLPNDGVVPLCESFDTVGPIARSVEDAACLLAVLQGREPVLPEGTDLTGTRIGVLEPMVLEDLAGPVAAGYEGALAALSGAGARLERFSTPEPADALALAAILFNTEAYATWGELIESAPEKMYHQVLSRFRIGGDVRGIDFVRAWQSLRRMRSSWVAATADYDAVVLPTTPNTPPNLKRLVEEPEYYVSENLLTLRNTRIANLLGVPALSLPTATPSVGIMLMMPPMSEAALLGLGATAEPLLRGA
ncbi:MAG: amidase family protein [Pseudomonadota bacterium]